MTKKQTKEYIVTAADGTIEYIEADTVSVDASGALILFRDGALVIVYAHGVWRTAREATAQ